MVVRITRGGARWPSPLELEPCGERVGLCGGIMQVVTMAGYRNMVAVETDEHTFIGELMRYDVFSACDFINIVQTRRAVGVLVNIHTVFRAKSRCGDGNDPWI